MLCGQGQVIYIESLYSIYRKRPDTAAVWIVRERGRAKQGRKLQYQSEKLRSVEARGESGLSQEAVCKQPAAVREVCAGQERKPGKDGVWKRKRYATCCFRKREYS